MQALSTPAYSETDVNGGGFGLNFGARTANDTRSELGARFNRAMLVGDVGVVNFTARTAWAHDWVSDPTLAATLKNTINTAVQQRTAVGLVGLLVALYSGINWMGNLREAIRAQSRDVWERRPQDEEKIWIKYFRDLISLIGLLVALIITLSITSVAGSAQQMIISALYLDNIEWLKPAWRLIGLAISIFANYLLFFWIFWRLPRHRPRRKALFRGTLIAAIGFEIIKIVMTWTLPALVKSPSGAAFGSVLGLMAFFYFFARLTLFCAAWIATAEYKDDRRMPGKTHR